MRLIQKGKEPGCLTQHRKLPEATYGNIRTECRGEMLAALCREQGYLCAYCMKRVGSESASIEHHEPQHPAEGSDGGPDFAMRWPSLLAVCSGNEGQTRRLQTCDTHRGNDPITVDPTDAEHMSQVRFSADGSISSANSVHDEDMRVRLNLNTEQLKSNRRAVLEAIVEKYRRRAPEGSWKPLAERDLARYEQADELPEYFGFVEFFLRKKVRQGAGSKRHRG